VRSPPKPMGRQAPAGLLGIHVNLPATIPSDVDVALAVGGPEAAGLSDKERAAFETLMTSGKNGDLAYFVMLTARPQAVGYGMTPLPASGRGFSCIQGSRGGRRR